MKRIIVSNKNCKDCLHYEACKDICYDISNGKYDDEDFNKEQPPDYCVHFTDFSEWVHLPCKVGDTLYTNVSMSGWYLREKDRPYPVKVVFIGINNSTEMGSGFVNVEYEKRGPMFSFTFTDFGKRIFFTREEAEKVLGSRY